MKRRFVVDNVFVVSALVLAASVVAEGRASAQPRWGRPGTPRAGACFFRDANFRGDYFCAEAGDEISSLPGRMNDEISSIRTFGGAEVTIYQNDRFGGRSTRVASDVSNLR